MAPIKFEDHIREQLQEREIQPSKDAWERLNLQKVAHSKSNKKAIWYAIAASIIGVIIVSSLIFRNQTTTVENTFTNQEKNVLPIEKEKKVIPIITDKKAIVSEEKKEVKKTQKAPLDTSKSKNIVAAKTKKPKINTSEIAIDNTVIIESQQTSKTEKDLFEESKINEVVAQVQAFQKENNSVTANEIETLLLQAQNEIYNKNLISKSKKVDATALLEMVETELETSFREKVFDALVDRFEKVRTAMVERDN